ncbi:unnamed protein product [Haemonchus placei]|uniref:Lipase_3 domain-containing protein n=1 Tax=Haemonchus placei TaxID=6290 RepID=A0A0N4W5I3_HAEPC|nr:unnamed protein product [Haemonchus placei]
MLGLLALCDLVTFILAESISRKPTYSDMFARTKMLPLAAAAYSNSPELCLANRFTNATLKSQVNSTCGPTASQELCSGFTAVIHDDGAIAISFRGTEDYSQLIAEADQSLFDRQISWIAGGKVSKYFFDAFKYLWDAGMGSDFDELRSIYPTYEIWVTGHSLGGALASLAASYIIDVEQVPAATIKLVTFGQPRTGNAFYEADMGIGANYTVCYANESRKCSDGLDYATSIQDHLNYFDVHVSIYGINGCNTTMDATTEP